MTFVTRPNGIELYHESQPFPQNGIGVKAFLLSQSATPYNESLNDVRFVDNFGSDIEAVTIGAEAGDFNVKVLVTDYEQEDFDAEQIVSTDGELQIFNEGNKRPQFNLAYTGLYPNILEIEWGTFSSPIFQSNNLIKNPNFPEGAGENFLHRPGVFNQVFTLTGNNNDNPATAQLLQGGYNETLGFGSNYFLDDNSVISELLSSILFNPNYTANPGHTIYVPITATDANEFDGVEGENPFKFVFTYTVTDATHPSYYNYDDGDENGYSQTTGLRLMGIDFDSNSMLGTSQMDLDPDGNLYVNADGYNIKNIPTSVGTHTVTFRVTGQAEGANNRLVLALTGTISFAPFIIENMSLQRIGHTHSINIPHGVNLQTSSEPYQLKVNHAWNETGFGDGAEVNDILNITKKALSDFDFATAGFTGTIQIDDGTSNLFDPNTSVEDNFFAVTSLPASVKWLLRGQEANTPAVIRFLNPDSNNIIFDPTADSAEFSPENNISLPPQVLGFYYERYNNDGGNIIRDDELIIFFNAQNVALNDSGLLLGVSHQRYLDTFGSYNIVVGGEDINFGHEQPIYLCQTSAALTNPSTGEFDIPRKFMLGAFANSPYTNLVNLTSEVSFEIEYSNVNDPDPNAVVEILGEDSLRWNVGNAVQLPFPNVAVSANNNNAFAVLKLKVPVGGAEYRVSFTTESWITKQFGDNNIQIDNKQTLAETSSTGNYTGSNYAITTHRVDMVNGRFVNLNANNDIRIGPNAEDVITFSAVANTLLESPLPDPGTYSIQEDNIDSIIAHVGNAHYCNILRPKHHQADETADNFIALELRFPFNVSFILNNLSVEQVTDPYSNTLTDDPYEHGTDTSPLIDEGTGVSSRYTIIQNPNVTGSHTFIDNGEQGTPMTNISDGSITTDGFGAVTLQGGNAFAFQIRSKHLAGQVNTSKLAISLDGGITYRQSGLTAADGIKPTNINHAPSTAVGGQGNVPIGQNNPGGAGNDIKRWNLQIFANLVIADDGTIGLIDTVSREFKIGLFENITPQVDNNFVDLTVPGGAPIEVFTIVQSGVDFNEENINILTDADGIVNSGDSII
jgi:hypothetical protein